MLTRNILFPIRPGTFSSKTFECIYKKEKEGKQIPPSPVPSTAAHGNTEHVIGDQVGRTIDRVCVCA